MKFVTPKLSSRTYAILAFSIAGGSLPPVATWAQTAPGEIKAEAPSATSIKLTWTDTSADEDGFKVERDGAIVKNLDAGATEWTDVGLATGTNYVYRVQAWKGATVAWSKKAMAMPTTTTEFWPVKDLAANAYQVGNTYCEYFKDYKPTDYHFGVDVMRVGGDVGGNKTVVAPLAGRINKTWNINVGSTEMAVEILRGTDFVSLWHLQAVKADVEVGGWVMAGVTIGEVGNNAFGAYGAHSHVNRDIASYDENKPTNMRHFLQLYTGASLKDPTGAGPEFLDRATPVALDGDTEKIQYRSDGGAAYITAKTVAAPPAPQPANAFIIKDKIDIVAEARDEMGHPNKPSALYSIAYWVKSKACDKIHDVRSKFSPYILHKCGPHLFNGAAQKTADIYETGKSKTWVWPNDTCGHWTVTNTKGTDGAMANVDKDQYWHTKAKGAGTNGGNGVGGGDATKAEEAYFSDGQYEVEFRAFDLIQSKSVKDQVWVENFPPAVKEKKPKPEDEESGGFRGGTEDIGEAADLCTPVITFSEPMNRQSVKDSITWKDADDDDVEFTPSWDESGCKVKLEPKKFLSGGEYEVTINADVAKDLSGGAANTGAFLDSEYGEAAHNGNAQGDPTDSVKWTYLCEHADFGDAYGGYASLLEDDGARHVVQRHEWLGSDASAEADADSPADPDGVPNLIARPQTWRDREGSADLDRYDDGVVFYPTTYREGETGDMDVTVCVADYAGGRYSGDPDETLYVNAWIDWNTDGVWSEGIEHVVDGEALVPSTGCTTLSFSFPVPMLGDGDLWARVRLDYGEDVGRNDPDPLFASDPSLDLVYGEARFGEVEDYYIGSDFGNLPDVNITKPNGPCDDAEPPWLPPCVFSPGYPTDLTSDGARHMNLSREGLGWSATREPDADEASNDEDGGANLDPCVGSTSCDIDHTVQYGGEDGFNDGVAGVITHLEWHGDLLHLKYLFFVRVTSTISSQGFGPQGRYDMTDDSKRLYIRGWMDKSFTGLLEEVAAFTADPETFGPDDRFTLGEDFEDLGLDGAPDTDDEGEDNDRFDFQDDNGNGFHDAGEAGEPYLDTAGADTMVFMTEEQECFGDACFLLLDWPPYRFRVDYGEDVMVPMGPAQWGEVEDYLHGGLMDYDTLLDVRDADDDDVDDIHDNSPFDFNPGQEDLDGDGIGDVSDPDDDNDGIVDTEDNSPKTPNAGQEDTDKDGDGDTTDPDDDGDGIADTDDNCPVNSNTDQDDCDADGTGDLCAIAEGASQDCNLNTMPDTCDITMGASLDVDENGVPDECEYNDCNGNGASDLDEIILGDGADCNTNGVLDSCDVTDGTSDDADGDGTLDECDFPDCNDNGMSDDADLVLGTSLDCNANELPDECDIAEGTSLDSNGDGVPDECAFEDCNVNGVADPTDISSGTSEDCNGNGIPDECEAAELVASEDFNVSPTEWTFLGNAAYNASEGDIRLVHSDVEFAAGVAFLNDLGLATDAFEVEFDFEMTAVVGGVPDGSGDSDPDGLAFIVTGAPVTAPGYNGYGLGYKNFPVDSFAVEFDTFQNFVSGQPDDPDSNHVAIDVGGKVDPSIATAYVQPDFEETGVWHGRVRFLGGELTVWATPPGDSEMKLITATIPAANIPAVKYIGFGAGTGINSADTDVDNVVITLLTNDCNANGVPDGCDIDDGASADANANGLPDVCESCEGDANGDGGVDPLDSGFVSARFGCPVGTGDPLCDAADVNGDGVVDPLDVGYVKARFGTCQN